MNTSQYQLLKIHILSVIHLSKDAIHIYLGLSIFFLWILIARKTIRSFKAIIPVLIVAVVMEALDLKDDYTSFGHLRWGASIHDILNTVFWPFLIVLLFKLKLIKTP